ncbi:MAG: DUF4277 domain-containing protein [Limnochordia bacterium]|nr:DUF4277 domain-containing protein [Limnochordia bacterium]MDD2630142.1 DUF4277 domain-containing protein [Limnochordia bacterium]MDD4517624.1 DUF4277 domain-containing protein [Limnochordia bacterium]
MSVLGEMDLDVQTFANGKPRFIAGVVEVFNIPQIIDDALTPTRGRKPDIPYGTVAKLMLINLCDDHHPLYLLDEYFRNKDLDSMTIVSATTWTRWMRVIPGPSLVQYPPMCS